MASIGEIIRMWLAEAEVPAAFCEQLLPVLWGRIAGERLARSTRPGPLQDGTLTVYVRSSYWKTHLAGMEDEILRQVRQAVPGDVVRAVELVSSPRQFPAKATPAPPAAPLPDALVRWAVRCAAPIEDPRHRDQFQETLLAFLARGDSG